MSFTKAPGVEDIFPDRIPGWNRITASARKNFELFNFREVIIPVMEYTELFSRGIGDETDIVSKEMFTFEDRGGRSLTLRPEGTASVVRAYNENGEYNRLSVCKLFYIGSMFRAERPQKGRLRQFNQFGAELFGDDSPFYDYEVISMMNSIALDLGISNYELLINSIGCEECRPAYLEKLKEYYQSNKSVLCEDCVKRLEKNPLRILDCKKEGCKSLKDAAPVLPEFLCSSCAEHHVSVKSYLSGAGIAFKEDPFLVRGLDYYAKTTFEFVTTALGGQNAFAAGGRYNKLVEILGGKPTPAVGFAAGIERLMILTEANPPAPLSLDAFIIYSDEKYFQHSAELLRKLRMEGISADIDPSCKSMKSQMKKMDRENARFALIIGDEEINEKTVTVKNTATREQQKISEGDVSAFIKNNKR